RLQQGTSEIHGILGPHRLFPGWGGARGIDTQGAFGVVRELDGPAPALALPQDDRRLVHGSLGASSGSHSQSTTSSSCSGTTRPGTTFVPFTILRHTTSR